MCHLPVDEAAGAVETEVKNCNGKGTGSNQKLSVKLITTHYDRLESFTKLLSGRFCCKIFKEFESVAKKFSQNQTLSMALESTVTKNSNVWLNIWTESLFSVT